MIEFYLKTHLSRIHSLKLVPDSLILTKARDPRTTLSSRLSQYFSTKITDPLVRGSLSKSMETRSLLKLTILRIVHDFALLTTENVVST